MSQARVIAACAMLGLLCACQAPRRPSPPSEEPPAASAESSPATLTRDPQPASPGASRAVSTPVADVASIVRGRDVIDRLVARLANPPCTQDRVVQRFEQIYARGPARFAASIEQVLPLMDLVVDEIELHALPGEFALIPVVESWYRPDAGSLHSTAGMWQFTRNTARDRGLRIVTGFDERLAPNASTRAAMHYLGHLQNRFGDWKLASMAFNAGEYRVAGALRKAPGGASAAAHLPAGLSMTTYEHLAKIQALACLLAQPSRFGIVLPHDAIVDRLRALPMSSELATIDAVAARATLDRDAVRALNPALLDGQRVAGIDTEVLLPGSAVRRVLAAAELSSAIAPPQHHVAVAGTNASRYRVRKGDTLGAIARRHGLSLMQLLLWNGLDPRALLQPGQQLRLEP